MRRFVQRLKNAASIRRWVDPQKKHLQVDSLLSSDDYRAKLAQETRIYKDVVDINVLPPIFHYWSHTYVRPMLEEYGVSNPDQFFAKYLPKARFPATMMRLCS